MAGACTTVRSTKVHAERHDAQGVTYFLPMKRLEVTVTRTPVKLKEMEAAWTAAQASAVKAREAAAAAKGAREVIEREIAKLSAEASAALRTKYADELETAKAKEKDTAEAKTKAEENEKVLRAGLDAANASAAECTYEAKVELMPAEPDVDSRYVARLAHNPLRDDSLTLKVGPTGLLSSTNMIAADRTGDIIVEAAGAISGLGSGDRSAFAEERNPPKTIPCAQLPRVFNASFDPKDGTPTTVNDELEAARYPFRVQVLKVPAKNAEQDPYAGLPGGVRRARDAREGSDYGATAAGRLYYRSPVPMLVAIRQSTEYNCPLGGRAAKDADPGCNWQPVDTAVVMVPQAGPRSFIPMNSAAFVKTVNDVQFVDGTISSWTAERPSEVLEVVRLPVRIATAVLSVPAQLFMLRVDLSTKEDSLIELQRAQIARDERARVWQSCLKLAVTDAERLACLPAP